MTKEVLVGSFGESKESLSDQKPDCSLTLLKNYRYHNKHTQYYDLFKEKMQSVKQIMLWIFLKKPVHRIHLMLQVS